MKRIAIFASGGGSNARKILEYFEDHDSISVNLIVTNRKNAGVLSHAAEFDVPTLKVNRSYFFERQCILDVLKNEDIDLIVLAGFLWLIPSYLVAAYPEKIVNIHPALLPKYGGKGMYGHHVHEAVKKNNESHSGITIHYVNEKFDDGSHIFQAQCVLSPEDSADDIAAKVLKVEHANYAPVIEKILLG